MTKNLPLSKRPFDYFFIVMFSLFCITSAISDAVPTLGIEMRPDSPNWMARANYGYANHCDPLFMHPPVWMRIVTGLSAFVYGPFYILLVIAFIKGWNKIQVPAIVYATAISVITGIIVFGVEFWGEPEWRCQDLSRFLPLNSPYVLVPLLLLFRMRSHHPFQRKF
jgi:hypothetical protein